MSELVNSSNVSVQTFITLEENIGNTLFCIENLGEQFSPAVFLFYRLISFIKVFLKNLEQ